MKKRYLTSLLLLGLMPFLTHCASQDDVNALNYHIRTLNKKVETMKEDTTVDQMQKRQASSSGMMDQLHNDILQLRSQLEENGHMTRMLQEQNKELQQAVSNLKEQQEQQLNTRMAELDNRIKVQEESLAALTQARIDDAERRSKAAARAAEDAMRRARATSVAQASAQQSGSRHISARAAKIVYSQAASSPTGKPEARVATPAPAWKPVVKQAAPVAAAGSTVDLFSAGEEKYNKGQYKEAFVLFEKHINKNGAKQATIPARYMMGECLFKQGEYDQAIIQYQQIISNFPGNPQAAKALLRQGEAFEQLSDNDTAKIIYKKVMASYGSTPEAEIARKRMSSL